MLFLEQSGWPRNNHLGFQEFGCTKLIEWSELNSDKLLEDLIVSKDQLKALLSSDYIDEERVLYLLKIFRRISLATLSQRKMVTMSLLRGSTFLKKHVQKYLIVWKDSTDNEKNLVITECLKHIIQEFLKLFPSSCEDLPFESFKGFLVKSGQIEFAKEVCKFDKKFFFSLKKNIPFIPLTYHFWIISLMSFCNLKFPPLSFKTRREFGIETEPQCSPKKKDVNHVAYIMNIIEIRQKFKCQDQSSLVPTKFNPFMTEAVII